MFDWDDFGRLSGVLFNKLSNDVDELCEAAQRTAISRQYYCFFHHIKTLNEYFDLSENRFSKDTHEDTLNKILKYKSVKLSCNELKILRDKMFELKGYRHQADYSPTMGLSDKRLNYILNVLPDQINSYLKDL